MMSGPAVMKVEATSAADGCSLCGATCDLQPLDEYDASPTLPPMRTMLLHLAHNKAIPSGRICGACAQRTVDAYELSVTLATRGAPPPLGERIRALRRRLHDLTQKIDVFIVVGSQAQDGSTGTYSEEDIIMVERSALAAAAAADDDELERAHNARGDTVYQCGVCPESFQRVSEYRLHCGTHPCDARHSCWTCGAQFPTRDSLHAHRASHDEPASPPVCHLCSTRFQSESELRRHEAAGAGACPCACPACGARYPDRGALSAHVRAQHGSAAGGGGPHVCHVCFAQYPAGSAHLLTAHALRHRHARQFVCGYDGCILRFATRGSLVSHIRKCHGGEAAGEVAAGEAGEGESGGGHLHCEHCDKTFGSAAAAASHARVHRDQPQHKQEVMEEEEEDEAGEGEVEYLEVETLEEDAEQDEIEYKPDLAAI